MGWWRAPRKAAKGRAGIDPRVKLGGAGEVFTLGPAASQHSPNRVVPGRLGGWGLGGPATLGPSPPAAAGLGPPPPAAPGPPPGSPAPGPASPPARPPQPYRPARSGDTGGPGHRPIGGGQGVSRPSPILAKPSGSRNAWAAGAGDGGSGAHCATVVFLGGSFAGRLAATRFVSIWGSMVQAWKLKLRPSLCEVEWGHPPQTLHASAQPAALGFGGAHS